MIKRRNNRSNARTRHSVNELFSGFGAMIRHYLWDKPRAFVELMRYRFRHLPETNYGIGCAFAEKGYWKDAIFRFKVALHFKPVYPQALYNMGICYMQLKQYPKAQEAFEKALRQQPGLKEAVYMLSSIAPQRVPPEQLPRTMPTDAIVNFFTPLAANYAALAEESGYQGPKVMADGLRPFLPRAELLRVLDVGCGTGLGALPWRSVAKEIVGIDLTPAMAAEARQARVGERPLYEKVLQEDVRTLSPQALAPGGFDVALLLEVAPCIGDLTSTFALLAPIMGPGAALAITIDPVAAPQQGLRISPETGRFVHMPDDVKRTAQAAGFELRRDGRVVLYADRTSYMLIFTKAV